MPTVAFEDHYAALFNTTNPLAIRCYEQSLLELHIAAVPAYCRICTSEADWQLQRLYAAMALLEKQWVNVQEKTFTKW